MATKIDVINDAYSRLRISGLTKQPGPEELTVALSRLEKMMAELESRNICLGYNFEETPDPNSPTGVTLAFQNMMAANLATRLIPDFNKEAHPKLYNEARQSLSNASGRSALARVREVPYPRRMPRGSGNTLRWNRYSRYYRRDPLPPNTCETNIMTTGQIDDYAEPFRAYLDGQTIASYTIEASSALNVVTSSNDDEIVYYRLEALDNTSGATQSVVITITTSTGRVEPRTVFFIVGRTVQDAI